MGRPTARDVGPAWAKPLTPRPVSSRAPDRSITHGGAAPSAAQRPSEAASPRHLGPDEPSHGPWPVLLGVHRRRRLPCRRRGAPKLHLAPASGRRLGRLGVLRRPALRAPRPDLPGPCRGRAGFPQQARPEAAGQHRQHEVGGQAAAEDPILPGCLLHVDLGAHVQRLLMDRAVAGVLDDQVVHAARARRVPHLLRHHADLEAANLLLPLLDINHHAQILEVRLGDHGELRHSHELVLDQEPRRQAEADIQLQESRQVTPAAWREVHFRNPRHAHGRQVVALLHINLAGNVLPLLLPQNHRVAVRVQAILLGLPSCADAPEARVDALHLAAVRQASDGPVDRRVLGQHIGGVAEEPAKHRTERQQKPAAHEARRRLRHRAGDAEGGAGGG
eukprot:CAMPEP_0198610582 /NCGR_PEP_ID=MMETSP1462-20131121/156969_1 /TAXON_ID=1333877 /ORGANISM="Brandtodinium nutriculum, Strain RCC3387" /LENGTH=389 /DNA_ID=CAMNT_0044342387 /DNA_START=182 /DNA_END=1347 /DNA_ORIENTATION=-